MRNIDVTWKTRRTLSDKYFLLSHYCIITVLNCWRGIEHEFSCEDKHGKQRIVKPSE